MSKSGLAVIAGVAVITLLALVYLAITYEPPAGTTTVVLPNPAAQPAAEPEPEEAPSSSLPRIRIEPRPAPPAVAAEPEVVPPPVEVESSPAPAPENESVVQLPSLNQSDGFVLEALAGLNNGARLVQLMADEQLVRRFVVLVENISRGNLPQTGLPYQGIGEQMPVTTLDDNLYVMDEAAYARFDPVIDTFVAVDTAAAVALYRTLSPLFQQAYAELGFRDREFDDVLRQAIDNVLASRELEGPFQLVKPSVMYLYADAGIENLSPVQKQLLRLGPENRAALKGKLRQFADRL